jgi:PAS domain S-box-containing protein
MNDIDRGGLFELFVDSLPDCAMCLLDIDGRILSWNVGASRILGYAADEIIGRNISSIHVDEDAAAKHAMSREQAVTHGRHEEGGRLVCRNGAELEARIVLIALQAAETLFGYGLLIREAASLARPAPALAAGSSGKVIPLPGPKKILVVDDNAEILEAVGVQLSSLGYKVIAAADATAALDLLSGGAEVDLLLTDVVMPGGMNGSQLAVEARRLRPGLKVLFTSGYFEVALIRDGTLDADARVLAKPFRKHQLAQSVSDALAN